MVRGECYMITHLLLAGSGWLSRVRFSTSARHSSKTLAVPKWSGRGQVRTMEQTDQRWYYSWSSFQSKRHYSSAPAVHPPRAQSVDWKDCYDNYRTKGQRAIGQETNLWRSDLEPTMTQGISVMPQKSTILSYTTWTISKEFRDATEYTRT